MVDHPRFGKIRSVVVMQDLEPGTELLTDYGYLGNYIQGSIL
jgi:hypothetical protein